MVEKKPSFEPRRHSHIFSSSQREQNLPTPGEEFTEEWIYLAHLLENMAKNLSLEKNHTKAAELLFRAEHIWLGIASKDTQVLTHLFSLIISLVRELMVLGRIEDAHKVCFRTMNRWKTYPFSSHQKLLFTHIRYCNALIAIERTIYDEAIREHEIVLAVLKDLSDENSSTFMPIMSQATLALQHFFTWNPPLLLINLSLKPAKILEEAYLIACEHGLLYPYIGKVHESEYTHVTVQNGKPW